MHPTGLLSVWNHMVAHGWASAHTRPAQAALISVNAALAARR